MACPFQLSTPPEKAVLLKLPGLLLFVILLTAASMASAATHIIDWNHANTSLVITGQATSNAVVTGNVLDAVTGVDSGYDFTLTLDIQDTFGTPATFNAGDPSLQTNGGEAGVLDLDIAGANRDSTTLLVASLSIDGGHSFADVDVWFNDLDRGAADAWIDEVTMQFGVGSNVYTYDSAFITQTGDSFVGDTSVPSSSPDGNLRVQNSGNVGSTLDFTYGPAAGDAFTSSNQRIAMGATYEFDVITVPEPSAALFLILSSGLILRRRR